MVFLRRDGPGEGERMVEGRGVQLRHPEMRDFEEWADLRGCSRAFLTPWEPSWAPDELSRDAYRRRLRRYFEDIRDGAAYPFLVFRTTDGRLVGGVTLSRVTRGVAQMASLGYWVGEPFRRQGHTGAAVRAVLGFAFAQIGLHRIEAACLAHNAASRGLLEGVGFTQEGVARRYLRIDGAWRDHVLYALLQDDPVQPAALPPAPPLRLRDGATQRAGVNGPHD